MIFRETKFAECGLQKQAWSVRSRKAPSQFFIALCQNKLMLMMILTSSQGFRVMYITNPCSPSLRYITYYPSNVCCACWYKKCTYLSQFPLFWTVKNIKTFSLFGHFFFRNPASILVFIRPKCLLWYKSAFFSADGWKPIKSCLKADGWKAGFL